MKYNVPVVAHVYPSEALYLWRLEAEFDMKEIARRLGVSFGDVYSFIAARSVPNETTRRRIEAATGGKIKDYRWQSGSEKFPYETEFGYALRVMRRRDGLLIGDGARVVGVSTKTMCYLEAGGFPADEVKERVVVRWPDIKPVGTDKHDDR